ncbi:MAG: FkbM family methyltransferase [Ilumatobacter sp.]|nr:FkbM family methyltransferase [Ilumatobacter sp.]MCB0984812.1 FkbM family methyltransferase [Ilumatobacter sp.]
MSSATPPAEPQWPPRAIGRAGALAALREHLQRPLSVIDAGARWGVADIWQQLGTAVRVVGFEPDVAEALRLQERYEDDPTVSIEPIALGERAGTFTLHITADASGSSLFRTDLDETDRTGRVRSREHSEMVDAIEVPVVRLDAWAAEHGLERMDVLKMDVQGAEADILRGAGDLLHRTRLVLTEVHLNPMYVGAPLFGEVDALLRAAGFLLWNFPVLVHGTLAGTAQRTHRVDTVWVDSVDTPLPMVGGQLQWADAMYVHRDVLHPPPGRDVQELLADAVAVTALGLDDLAAVVLTDLARVADDPVAGAAGDALTALRWIAPLDEYRGANRRHADTGARPVTAPWSLDLAAPLAGWGWHDPQPAPHGTLRWTGLMHEAGVRLPVRLRAGDVVELELAGAAHAEMLPAVTVELDDAPVDCRRDVTPTGAMLLRVVAPKDSPGAAVVVLHTPRPVPFCELHPESDDRTRLGVALAALRVLPHP